MKHNDTRQLRGVEIGHDRPDIRITTLNPDDWEKLRDLKIQSLKEEPIAFENVDAGIAKYEQRTEQEWREALGGKLPDRAGERYMLFAMEDNRPVGMVEIIVPDSEDGELKLAII